MQNKWGGPFVRMISCAAHHHLSVARSVKFDQEHPLPRSQREPAVGDRNMLAAREQQMHQVGVRVGALVGGDRRFAPAHVVVVIAVVRRADPLQHPAKILE
jgi:hypothetical protein